MLFLCLVMKEIPKIQLAKASVYIETYGCQMNVADSEILASILGGAGYVVVEDVMQADVALVNTCAIRENAEQRVVTRLFQLRKLKGKKITVGVIGCMAERLGEELFKKADLVVGPDSYRMLPQLIEQAQNGVKGMDIQLSEVETYGDVEPVRISSNGVSGWVSIMRGCNNFCSYCVVPYTRGRERSREVDTILRDVEGLLEAGYREVTLLGQNVNSYNHGGLDFPELMRRVAQMTPELRVRFSTSHPKDLSDSLIEVMASHKNIARHVHLPVQSGSDKMLKAMNRKYTVQWYLDRLSAIRTAMPNVGISTDIITGFCGETDDDHKQTMQLMDAVGYDFAYMYAYSERPGTFAHGKMTDNVPQELKIQRLNEVIANQGKISLRQNQKDLGQQFEVLIEGTSKRSDMHLTGRTSQNKVMVFDAHSNLKAGDYTKVTALSCSSATLRGF